MTRSVVVLDFAGVQPLDSTGPLDVFTSASIALAGRDAAGDGYAVTLVSPGGRPVSSGFGLHFVAHPLPDPSAAIDTLLLPGLVEDDHGTEVAQLVARWLVLHLRRPGGQSQFAPPVWMPRARRRPIRDVQEAIEKHPAAAHRIADLATIASMSPRHFTRVFTEEVGEPPGVYVERVRTDTARRFLEEIDDPMPAVASRAGFGSAETMRRVFVRRLAISPDRYRRSCR